MTGSDDVCQQSPFTVNDNLHVFIRPRQSQNLNMSTYFCVKLGKMLDVFTALCKWITTVCRYLGLGTRMYFAKLKIQGFSVE